MRWYLNYTARISHALGSTYMTVNGPDWSVIQSRDRVTLNEMLLYVWPRRITVIYAIACQCWWVVQPSGSENRVKCAISISFTFLIKSVCGTLKLCFFDEHPYAAAVNASEIASDGLLQIKPVWPQSNGLDSTLFPWAILCNNPK